MRGLLTILAIIVGIYLLGVSGFFDVVIEILRLLIDLVEAIDPGSETWQR